ncbi:MAG: hypothetical protein ACRC8P_01040 [Spiroplasma sp.]
MFKRFLLLVVTIPALLGFTSNIVACEGELSPQVLLITSYKNAQERSSEDKIIYQKLRSIYGDVVVAAFFSHEDDSTYADILVNLLTKFNLKKVFIQDPAFINYLPKTSTDSLPNSNLIRVLQKFSNIDFFFFNNQIANTIKVSNNIYEFRFDSANKDQPDSALTYGAIIAKHFRDQLVNSSGTINTDKYNFAVDNDGKWIIRIGVIDNIGSDYQQKIIDDFILSLNNNIPVNTKYEYYHLKLNNISNSYNPNNIQLVETAAKLLYQQNYVNFIFNSNFWYNDSIAHAASSTASLPKYTKTVKFIASNVLNKDDYKYQGVNYMIFSYHLDFSILGYTIDNSIPTGYQVVKDAPENNHAYGLNNNLNFVDDL